MPQGAGNAPAGDCSAGYGVPDNATKPNNALLPDLRTGLPQTGRYIDPVTKSYKFTADGRLYGLGTAQQLVQLALTQVRGSSCVPQDGQTFATIREKTDDFKNRVARAVSDALASLVRQKIVRIENITVYETPAAPDAAIGWVGWRDLTTGTFNRSNIGP